MEQQEKLYSQNEIARKLGVSNSTLSRWVEKYSIVPEHVKGRQKFYSKEVVNKLKKFKNTDTKEKTEILSPIVSLKKQLEAEQTEQQLLKEQLADKDARILELKEIIKKQREQLKDQKKLLADKDKQIKEQSAALIDQTKTISDFGSKFAQLADQSQKLNLLDKPQKEQPTQTKKAAKDEPEQPHQQPWYKKFF